MERKGSDVPRRAKDRSGLCRTSHAPAIHADNDQKQTPALIADRAGGVQLNDGLFTAPTALLLAPNDGDGREARWLKC